MMSLSTMGSLVDTNKFSWVIKSFNLFQTETINSDQFIIGGCKWCLFAYPKGDNANYLSLYIAVSKYGSLPLGWKRHAKVTFTVVNQLCESLSHVLELQKWFDEKTPAWGFAAMFPLALLHCKDSSFLVNGELKILAEVDVLEAIESEDGVLSSYLLNMSQQLYEILNVDEYLVLSLQVESAKRLFESHRDIASGVRIKSHHFFAPLSLETHINVLVGLVEKLCQPPQELTDDDLKEVSGAASYFANVGFKVDWLEKKLHQVMEKKNRVHSGEARLLEMEQKLLKLKAKCPDLEADLEKEEAEVEAAKIPLTFDDFL